MNGKIYFSTTDDLVEFLVKWTGHNATFEVRERDGLWVLAFLGGF